MVSQFRILPEENLLHSRWYLVAEQKSSGSKTGFYCINETALSTGQGDLEFKAPLGIGGPAHPQAALASTNDQVQGLEVLV